MKENFNGIKGKNLCFTFSSIKVETCIKSIRVVFCEWDGICFHFCDIKIKFKRNVFIHEKLSLNWDVHYFGYKNKIKKKKVFIEEKLSLSWDVHYFGLILSTSTIKGQSPEFLDSEVWLLTALPSAKGT